MAMTALAVVLLAQAAPALAQSGDDGRGPEASRGSEGRGQGGGERTRPQFRGDGGRRVDAPRAPAAPQAAQPEAPQPRQWNGERSGRRPEARAEQPSSAVSGGERAWRQDRGGRRGPDDRRGQGDQRRWSQDGQGPAPGVSRDWRRRDDGRRDDGNRADGRWTWEGQHDRDGRNDRDWNRRDGDRRWEGYRYGSSRYNGYTRWARGRYPNVYVSRSRHDYARPWRPPVGYYVRAWNFGDYLPYGWYQPDWQIIDPWAYGLPLPPPGFDWVRVGADALMVDLDSGEIVQVVRNVFW
jgi:Ni/Co efflux regulator RcnB